MGVEQVGVGILGMGIVGCGTYQALTANADDITRRVGARVTVLQAADVDWARPRDVQVPTEIRTEDAAAVIRDPAIGVVVETIGGTGVARELVLQAIAHGKSVVTSNKELIAWHGAEILDAARDARVDVEFEGSVGGVMPIVRSLKESLAATEILSISGILNGTTNYILTRMSEDSLPFDEALREAQQSGYAEQDPTADVEGHDAANKIAILAAIAFGTRVPVAEAYREGISRIAPVDIEYARRLGYVIKLLAITRRSDGEIELRVHPTLVSVEHPLASVKGVYNAVFVEGVEAGEVMILGRGAGSLPTGTAVAGDVVDCARNIVRGCRGRVPCTCEGAATIRPMDAVATANYLRMRVKDRPGVIGAIATVLGEEHVSIESVVQQGSFGAEAEIVWITHQVAGRHVDAALRRIEQLDVLVRLENRIRVAA